MFSRFTLSSPDIFKSAFNEFPSISSLRIEGGKIVDGIRCRISHDPTAISDTVAFEIKPGESSVLDLAILERAVNELVAIEKHILTLKSMVLELHNLPRG